MNLMAHMDVYGPYYGMMSTVLPRAILIAAAIVLVIGVVRRLATGVRSRNDH